MSHHSGALGLGLARLSIISAAMKMKALETRNRMLIAPTMSGSEPDEGPPGENPPVGGSRIKATRKTATRVAITAALNHFKESAEYLECLANWDARWTAGILSENFWLKLVL
ncbi:MAG: hypothetical protein IT424_12625 [Pirellulales bacterium]|nr:hypothetical protein [Pirellulales bacterium]